MTLAHAIAGWFIKLTTWFQKIVIYGESMGRLASGAAQFLIQLSLCQGARWKLQPISTGFLAQFKATRTTYLAMYNVHHTTVYNCGVLISTHTHVTLELMWQLEEGATLITLSKGSAQIGRQRTALLVPLLSEGSNRSNQSHMTYLLAIILRQKTPQFQRLFSAHSTAILDGQPIQPTDWLKWTDYSETAWCVPVKHQVSL